MIYEEAPSEVQRLLAEVFRPGAWDLWLNHPNQLLGGETPAQEIRDGNAGRVEALLLALAEGVVL